jgi:hypothetical protein
MPISCGFLAFPAVAATLSRFGIVSDTLSRFINGSEALVVTGRDKDATWCSAGTLCRERGWSKRRLLYELRNGLSNRTIPPGGTIDWHDPNVERTLDLEASEVSFYDEKVAAEVEACSSDQVVFFSLGLVTVGFEVLAPTDAEALSHPAHTLKATTVSDSVRWAIAATRNLWAEKKISTGTIKADLARLLETESQKAVKAGQISRALKASYIENQLVSWGIWPLN